MPTIKKTTSPTTASTKQAKPVIPASCRAGSPFMALVKAMRKRVAEMQADAIFVSTVNTNNIWDFYLNTLPADRRQEHRCNCCMSFIRRYGNLVVLREDGTFTPLIWPDVDELPTSIYTPFLRQVHLSLCHNAIEKIFFTTDAKWGTAQTGIYRHFAVDAHSSALRDEPIGETLDQQAATLTEDVRMLTQFLHKAKLATLQSMVGMLSTQKLDRHEKFLGWAQWLVRLRTTFGSTRSLRMLWLEAYKSPAGWAHVNGSMMGWLYDAIQDGRKFDAIRKDWNKLVRGDNYQRTTAVSEGNVKQASKFFEESGFEASLARRFCRMDDIAWIWKPKPVISRKRDVIPAFQNITPTQSPVTQEIGGTTDMSFTKFRRDVMPLAQKIEFLVPYSGNFGAFLTAVNPRAKGLFQWANHVNAYCYTNGSSCAQWNLTPMVSVEVKAIALQPHQWEDENAFPHLGKGAFFVLDGAKERMSPGMCLFPEVLRKELHAYRSTIEGYNNTHTPEKVPNMVAGYLISDSKAPNIVLKVTTHGITSAYRITCWE